MVLRLGRNLVLFVILISITVAQVNDVSAQANQIKFIRTPLSYNPQIGSFTLGEQAYGGDLGNFCLGYDYFTFNATAGQAVSFQVDSPGQIIYYAIINASQFPGFNAAAQNCYLRLNSPIQDFNSKTSLNWTAPGSGQFVLLFYTRTYFTRPLYLTQ